MTYNEDDEIIKAADMLENDNEEESNPTPQGDSSSVSGLADIAGEEPGNLIREKQCLSMRTEDHQNELAKAGGQASKRGSGEILNTQSSSKTPHKKQQRPEGDDASVSDLVSTTSTAIYAREATDLLRQENIASPTRYPGAERVSSQGTRGLPGGDSEGFGVPDDETSTTSHVGGDDEEEAIIAVPVTDSQLVDESQQPGIRDASTISAAEVVPVDGIIKRNRRIRLGLVVTIILLVAIVLGLVLGLARANDAKAPSPTEAPTSPILEKSELVSLIEIWSPGSNLSDVESPQGQAFEWMTSDVVEFSGISVDGFAQLYALATLFYATNGTAAWEIEAWLNSTDPCVWGDNNVVCEFTESRETEVRQLLLGGGGLDGSLPVELSLLTQLSMLILNSNDLVGPIPSELGLLTNLKELRLNSNALTGTIPTELANLVKLTALVLYNNAFTGTVPSELGALTFLTQLSMRDNTLNGTLPSTLGNLTNMVQMLFYDNFFVGSIPSEIGRLTQMTELSIRDNMLSGSLPTEFGHLLQMNELVFYLNQLSGTIPSEIGLLTKLTVFSVRNNRMTGSIPPQLGELSLILRLWLYDNQLTGNIPAELGALTALTRLWMYDNNVTGSIPASLCLPLNTPRIDCGEIACNCCENATGGDCPVF